MKTLILFLIFGIFAMSLVSAVPQVIFTNFNLSIVLTPSNLSYRIIGEGVDLKESIILNLSSINLSATPTIASMGRDNVPLQFSRDVCENPDMAVLIRALSTTNNITQQWMDCVVKYAECNKSTIFAGNYTTVKAQYDSCLMASSSQQNSINDKDTRIKDLESQRLLVGGVAALCAFFAWHFWKKSTPRVLDTPSLSQLPRSQRV